jgi:hypothetical protein
MSTTLIEYSKKDYNNEMYPARRATLWTMTAIVRDGEAFILSVYLSFLSIESPTQLIYITMVEALSGVVHANITFWLLEASIHLSDLAQ